MGLFDKLFGKKPLSLREMNKMPPIHGGDATSPRTAAIINCASMDTAHGLTDRFMSERHGKKDVDWKPKVDFFVNESGIPEATVRAHTIITTDGASHTYYFDVSRPMKGTAALMKMMGITPDNM